MLIRALIVLLVVLNLGVAAWWLTRPTASPAAMVAEPEGTARLQLLSEAMPTATPAVVADAAVEVAPVEQAVVKQAPVEQAPAPDPTAAIAPPAQCFSLGPFNDRAAATAAATRLGKQALRPRPREVPGKAASAYNVILPAAANREAAQALAQRIGAAGFDDFLVINQGEQANGIALGRYGSREAAQRRQSALQAAGFQAQIQAVGGEGAAQWWLDLTAAEGAAAAQLQALSSATQSRSLDCAALR